MRREVRFISEGVSAEGLSPHKHAYVTYSRADESSRPHLGIPTSRTRVILQQVSG